MATIHFETIDDGLAAFFVLRGVRHIGLGVLHGGTTSEVSHVFDDDPGAIALALASYRDEKRCTVEAPAFLRLYEQLRRTRLDEGLRRAALLLSEAVDADC